MKNSKDIDPVSVIGENQDSPSYDQLKVIRSFGVAIVKLFPQSKQDKSGLLVLSEYRDLNGNIILRPDGSGQPKMQMKALDDLLKIYWREILAINPSNRELRIRKIKELIQAGHKSFQWPDGAIIHGCAAPDIFNQLYREKYPHRVDTASHREKPPLLQLQDQAEKPPNAEAKKAMDEIKSLFP